MQRIKAGKLTRPSQLVSNYPVELEAIVMKALQLDPIDRFADADALRRAVEALGHRLHLVLGDAAIIEVMAQLFEPHAPPKPKEPPPRMSDPSFEWLESDHALTVRREPEELLAQLRNESLRSESRRSEASSSGIIDEALTRPLGSMGMPDEPPRKLRAATEAADALGAQAFETPAPGLPLASPPPTPVMTAIPRSAAPATPRGMTAAPITPRGVTAAPSQQMPSQLPPAQAPLAPPKHPETLIGATIVRGARKRRGVLLHWVAAGAVAAVLGVIAYFVTQESPAAVAGSASPPVGTPAAARAPTPPAPPKPVHTDPPPPPAPPMPAQVRVKIVTHPPDATVMLDGKKLGRTPFDETIDADPGKHLFRLRHRGYTTHKIDITLDTDITQDIALTPLR
jgi:serine/threonine-protein kinase